MIIIIIIILPIFDVYYLKFVMNLSFTNVKK